ncbi:phosphopantothenoylcysteine decarboxylase isoform X4 [Rissa tridactyla]|uniref:phosphopantothenoylcysteine decarboxylase isoform X4 n=1 Tax=Rissa tridactyla TaxID=75485 RepID=UPI0023BB03D0|nr:phosphopantothenoylcysteine decarboxylase isoform X4 [Rissa tridactyla]
MEPFSEPEPGFPAEKSSSVPQKKFCVLVGVTGSVAALKLPLLIAELLKIPGLWKGRSDPVLHIELRRWADLMLVAPLDANTLAKLANGICDNLLTCVIRAWDLSKPLLFCPAMNTAMWEHPITARQVEQLKGFGYTEIPCVVKKLVCGDEGFSPQGLFHANFGFVGFIHKGVCPASTQAAGRGAMAEVWTIVESVKRMLEEQDLPTQS